MSDPAPPPGFVLDEPPPAGLVLDGDAPAKVDPVASALLTPTGEVVDGDTFRTAQGPNARLQGADAFELKQSGRLHDGAYVPLGEQARGWLGRLATPGATVSPTGGQTYGRPVVNLSANGVDAGSSLISQGLAVPDLRYVTPEQLAPYVAAQRDAIASERGAYGGQYQSPADYRKQGAGAPWAGKITMQPDEAAQWERLIRNPTTTAEQAGGWLASRGHSAENIGNLVRFMSRNPDAEANPAFQQRDAQGNPVQAEPRGLMLRAMDAINEGLIDIPAGFLDLSHAVMSPIGEAMGVDMGAGSPVSAWGRDQYHDIGFGQRDEGSAPRSDLERYAQAFLRGTGSAVIPFGGSVALGGKLAMRGPSLATGASAARTVAREGLVDAAKNPGVAAALEVGAGAGSYIGEEAAHDIAPGNPYAAMAGQLVGGLGGGLASGAAARRFGSRSSGDTVASAGAPDRAATDFDPAAPMVERDGALFARAADGREVPIPIDPSGHPGIIQGESGWEALVEVAADGTPGYGPVGGPDSLPSRYADLVRDLNGSPAVPAPAPAASAGVASHRVATDPVEQMEGGAGRQELVGPAAPVDPAAPRQRDVIDVSARARPLLDPATEMQRMRAAEQLQPGELLPIPSSRVADVDEAAAIERGRYQRERAGDPRKELETRGYRSPKDGLKILRRKGPPDLVTWLRSEGGMRLSDQDAGEFRHYGIDNAPRDLEFAKGEGQLGKLLDDEGGMPADYAAMRAWEAGYFPDLVDRPTIDEFMDALVATHRGGSGRVFHPDDLPELDRYRHAQGQYKAVKAAEQEGKTLVADRGEPITLDDLDANAAPVRAYEEWGENAPDFAGNIRLDKLDSPQDIKRALTVSEARVGGFDAARRGRITQAETQQLAAELGMTPDDLLRRRKGQSFNAEEALAARQILAKSGNELVNLARRMRRSDGNPSTEEAARLRQAWLRHVAIQEQVAGMTAEAGRTLQQFRQIADSRGVRGIVLPELVDGAGGVGAARDAADMIIDAADDPGKLAALTQRALKPGFKDKLLELWYNAILSGPQTHAVNILSNTMTSLGQLPEHAVAATIGGARRVLPNQAQTDRVLFSELGARATGLIAGTREGLRNAWRTLKTGEPSDLSSKVEALTQRAIPGVKGSIIRTPSRALSSEDELFKAMARRMELHGLAVREAAKEGLTGKAARQRAAEIVANPTDDLLAKSFDYGRYLTFQRPLGQAGTAITRFVNELDIFGFPALKFVVPFIRTPANLLKFTMERSPAAPLLKEWRTDFAAGGAKRDLAVARAMVGTGVMVTVGEMAAKGLITGGGPKDDERKNLLRANGWQPYSIKVGDTYYSYQRLDPFASTLGIAADMVDLQDGMNEEEQDQIALSLGMATIKNLTSKTWLSSLTGLMEAIEDPDRNLQSFTSRLAGSAVPAGVAQVARITDPILREAKTGLDRIRSRIPGVSDALAPRRDLFGKPLVSEGGLGPDIVSPMWQSTDKADPIAKALLDGRVAFGQPRRLDGMTDSQWGEYQGVAGALLRGELESLTTSPEWTAAGKDDKQDQLDKAVRDTRKMAKALIGMGQGAEPAPPPGFTIQGAPPPPGFVLDQ